METLPLFPLPVVLFPGARLPLHIFEARYRSMVARCLEFDRRFGLIFHDSDDQGPFLMEEARVGTVALIEQFQGLQDGRSLIVVTGEERIQIVNGLDQREMYYEAEVRPYADVSLPKPGAMDGPREQTLELFHTVVEQMADPPEQMPEFDLQEDLSFQMAPLIQIDARWQQSFLELKEETHRLERLDAVFQAAVDRS